MSYFAFLQASNPDAASSNTCLTVVITWLPILALLVFFVFFMRRMGYFSKKSGYVKRTEDHMERVEQTLNKIEEHLRKLAEGKDDPTS